MLEEWRFLAGQGVNRDQAAAQLGISRGWLDKLIDAGAGSMS